LFLFLSWCRNRNFSCDLTINIVLVYTNSNMLNRKPFPESSTFPNRQPIPTIWVCLLSTAVFCCKVPNIPNPTVSNPPQFKQNSWIWNGIVYAETLWMTRMEKQDRTEQPLSPSMNKVTNWTQRKIMWRITAGIKLLKAVTMVITIF
jgi:hypothetical protein